MKPAQHPGDGALGACVCETCDAEFRAWQDGPSSESADGDESPPRTVEEGDAPSAPTLPSEPLEEDPPLTVAQLNGLHAHHIHVARGMAIPLADKPRSPSPEVQTAEMPHPPAQPPPRCLCQARGMAGWIVSNPKCPCGCAVGRACDTQLDRELRERREARLRQSRARMDLEEECQQLERKQERVEEELRQLAREQEQVQARQRLLTGIDPQLLVGSAVAITRDGLRVLAHQKKLRQKAWAALLKKKQSNAQVLPPRATSALHDREDSVLRGYSDDLAGGRPLDPTASAHSRFSDVLALGQRTVSPWGAACADAFSRLADQVGVASLVEWAVTVPMPSDTEGEADHECLLTDLTTEDARDGDLVGGAPALTSSATDGDLPSPGTTPVVFSPCGASYSLIHPHSVRISRLLRDVLRGARNMTSTSEGVLVTFPWPQTIASLKAHGIRAQPSQLTSASPTAAAVQGAANRRPHQGASSGEGVTGVRQLLCRANDALLGGGVDVLL